MRNRVRPVVVETKPIDQRLLLGQSKNARLGVSGCAFAVTVPNLDKTEPERCPCGKSNTVLVQPGRESNWVWEFRPKSVSVSSAMVERLQRKIEMRRAQRDRNDALLWSSADGLRMMCGSSSKVNS